MDASSITVMNAAAAPDAHIVATPQSNPGRPAAVSYIEKAAGQFTIHLTAATTAATPVSYLIFRS